MSAEDDFWEYSFELSLIRKIAHWNVGSPWAYLGACMARAATAVPYNVVLPPTIGAEVSTGMYVALVGDPGHGKGSSDSAANRLMPCDIATAKLGSGEGITHQYAYRERGDDELQWRQRSVLFESSEAETMRALSTRTSSTLMGEVRSAWMGEPIGFGYSNVQKRMILPRLSYRLSILASFTPSMGDVLLDGIAEGTPQRFLFLPVHDPNMPDEEDMKRPKDDQIILKLPKVDDDELVEVRVPGWISRKLRDDHRSKVRREIGTMTDEELLDTHINLVQLKVAFAIGIILNAHRDKYVVSSDDWDLAGYVMEKSQETRTKLIAAAEVARHSKDKKEGRSLGVRYAASDEMRKVGPATDRIMAILLKAKKGKSDGWVGGGKLRSGMNSAQREVFDIAIVDLENKGKVESADTIVTINNTVLGRRYRAR